MIIHFVQKPVTATGNRAAASAAAGLEITGHRTRDCRHFRLAVIILFSLLSCETLA